MITSSEGTQWLGSLDSQHQYAMLADWAELSKNLDRLLPLPKELRESALVPYREQPRLEFEGRR
jgi:hypothetical protein